MAGLILEADSGSEDGTRGEWDRQGSAGNGAGAAPSSSSSGSNPDP